MRRIKRVLNKPVVGVPKPQGVLQRLLRSRPVTSAIDFALSNDPLGTRFEDVEPASMYRSATYSDPGSAGPVKVMTWNVKFGGARIDFFFDSHGDRVHMTEPEVRRNVCNICEALSVWQPDIVLLQEVDVESKRCAFVDLVQLILDRTHFNFGAYASQWKAEFVPSYGIGRVDSGNAILSRWPIRDAKRIALATIESHDPLTRYFWLRRNLLHGVCETPIGEWDVFNTHLSAFSSDGTKKRQIDQVLQYVNRSASRPTIVGGDFNTVAPGTRKLSGFDDLPPKPKGAFDASSFDGQQEWLRPFFDQFSEAIPLSNYAKNNAPYLTHTTDGRGFWNRRLDYLFTNLEVVSGAVYQRETMGVETMPLSDHAPVVAELS